MERTVFLNGDFMPESEARLPIFDRGLLFADSVYEGFGILDSQITDFEYHMNRLDRREWIQRGVPSTKSIRHQRWLYWYRPLTQCPSNSRARRVRFSSKLRLTIIHSRGATLVAFGQVLQLFVHQ